MKKLLVVLMIVALVMVFAAPALAAGHRYPPTPAPSVGVAPLEAAFGLHTACPNLDPGGIAFHVFLFRLGPGPH